MAAACACEVFESHQQQAAAAASGADARPTPASSLTLARSYLQAARAAGAGLATRAALASAAGGEAAGQQAGDAKTDVYLLLLVGGAGGCCWCGGSELAAAVAPLVVCRPGTSRACLQDFKLCALAGDTSAQLAALDSARASPTFGAQHFAMAAALARGGAPEGRPHTPEVCRAAEAARLQRLAEATPLDYAAAAAVRLLAASAVRAVHAVLPCS